ncbi:MAG TPA: hypothetical protein VHI98_03860 [Vicinamibacterales bacterium]|nr:hypothetical protein [Vicinamibacterales bacterium]
MILPKDRHHFGLAACGPIMGKKELLHRGLASNGGGKPIVALTVASFDFDFQRPNNLLT